MKSIDIVYRYSAIDSAARPRPGDAEAALKRLDDGGRMIAELCADAAEGDGTAQRVIELDAHDLGLAKVDRAAPKQRPYAAILGCSDARVPIELIFNEGPNDLFVVRVAGNGLGSDVLGSLKYAVAHLGGSLKLIVVLGHSGCGAVSAAVDVFLNPENYLSFVNKQSLRNIVDRLVVVVHTAARRMQATLGPDVAHRAGYRLALTETAIVLNAALTAHTVQQEMGDVAVHGVRAAYGSYLLASHRVWAPRGGSSDHAGLAYPPADAAAFGTFADAVLLSDRIQGLLEHGAEHTSPNPAGNSTSPTGD